MGCATTAAIAANANKHHSSMALPFLLKAMRLHDFWMWQRKCNVRSSDAFSRAKWDSASLLEFEVALQDGNQTQMTNRICAVKGIQ